MVLQMHLRCIGNSEIRRDNHTLSTNANPMKTAKPTVVISLEQRH